MILTEICSDGKVPLDFGSWEPALDSPDFPGSVPAKAQVFGPLSHPHLRMDEGALMSIPPVQPGDQVFCTFLFAVNVIRNVLSFLSGHTDLIHAVEAEHSGKNDSVVLYIPAVPFTVGKYVPRLYR